MRHCGTRTLETERLILRRFTTADAGAMYANWASDPEVTRYLTWPAHASVDLTGQLLAHWNAEYERPDCYNWALELKATGEPIGSLAVVRVDEALEEAELGYCMGRRWWGMGLMPEAVREAMRYLFDEVGFNRIVARHDAENPKSGRVMQKAGMLCEGRCRQGGRNNRGIIDDVWYGILRSDFHNAKALELWDARDRNGRPLGVELVRGEPIPDGMYHVVCGVIVRHRNGDFLVMRRDPRKHVHPGEFELTAGGSALRGESPLACIRRELLEETGIECDAFTLLSVEADDGYRCLFYEYCCETDCDPNAVRLQPGETVEYRWVSLEALRRMMDDGALIPSTRKRLERWLAVRGGD